MWMSPSLAFLQAHRGIEMQKLDGSGTLAAMSLVGQDKSRPIGITSSDNITMTTDFELVPLVVGDKGLHIAVLFQPHPTRSLHKTGTCFLRQHSNKLIWVRPRIEQTGANRQHNQSFMEAIINVRLVQFRQMHCQGRYDKMLPNCTVESPTLVCMVNGKVRKRFLSTRLRDFV